MKPFIRFTLIAASLLAIFNAHAEQEPAAADTPAPRRVQPLDHGPRAQSTPWVNAQIRQREARETEAARKAARSEAHTEAHAAAAAATSSAAVN